MSIYSIYRVDIDIPIYWFLQIGQRDVCKVYVIPSAFRHCHCFTVC